MDHHHPPDQSNRLGVVLANLMRRGKRTAAIFKGAASLACIVLIRIAQASNVRPVLVQCYWNWLTAKMIGSR
jgi:hypothetical protein